MRCAVAFLISALLLAACAQAQHPRDAEINREAHDADTLSWWHRTELLSGDSMRGREPGTPEYDRAAQMVADDFRRSGLKPAGENGTYFEAVPLRKLDLDPQGTRFVLEGAGAPVTLRNLQEIAVRLTPETPRAFHAGLLWTGYCEAAQLRGQQLEGKIAACFRPHLGKADPGTSAALTAAHVAGVLWVDDPSEPLEPPRWPLPTARAVSLREPERAAIAPSYITLRLNWEALPQVLRGSGHTAAELLASARAHSAMPAFALPSTLNVKLAITTREFTANNVLAVLPGTTKPGQYLAVSAHLDGYGVGEPVGGDVIYNGTLDDAAYVALLEQLAARRHGAAFARSILFCAFTGEEEGLLGSEWFTEHPTVLRGSLIADINLDQLRPLFPLKALTTLAVDDSTLGAIVRSVAAKQGIEIRADREPERGLLHRSDHWPFMQINVPAVGFIFGYDPGTEAEQRYRTWYRIEYHRPQDDLLQPVDFAAARNFDRFFYALVSAVADAPERPEWLPAGAKDHPAQLAAH